VFRIYLEKDLKVDLGELGDEIIAGMLADLDINGDGKIDYNEFSECVKTMNLL
jgi:Ca2+-binding EF-hand superfamily protein